MIDRIISLLRNVDEGKLRYVLKHSSQIVLAVFDEILSKCQRDDPK